ncbi:OLC1v1001287C1 [Oldenlandia corymbosa var. corymbosa]|uniref:OLC1v1001287C1 n=1 Tax=Oldenlandia corymbosa var. corymbosa TaxID=529605 RepID=A0AAV1D8E8_OLDCO|nr:OLC1v1001287C1 [Oldenlandia corymbosa var. corymbosa]
MERRDMDDGGVVEAEVLIPNSDSSVNVQSSVSMDSFFDELLKNAQTSCTHTHTCNPPGPDDSAHTHTCYHTHTQVIQPDEKLDFPTDNEKSRLKSKRPSGNREAVRKYREKKKAHSAFLEEEVRKLRLVNQQLIRKVQRQTIMEAEILRLKGLLLDLRGKIDVELGSSAPFQKDCNSGLNLGLRCENELTCLSSQGVSSESPLGDFGGCNKTGTSLDKNCQSAAVADQSQEKANSRETGRVGNIDSVEIMVSSASQEDE